MALWVFDIDGTLVTSNIDYGFAVLDFTEPMLATLEHKLHMFTFFRFIPLQAEAAPTVPSGRPVYCYWYERDKNLSRRIENGKASREVLD